MSMKNSEQCRKNLTVDLKLWYAEHDHMWHGNLIGYEDATCLHSIKASSVREICDILEGKIASMMQEEASYEVQRY